VDCLGDDEDSLQGPRVHGATLGAGDTKPVLDPPAMRRADHHVLLEDVVRQAGFAQARDYFLLTMRTRGDFPDVWVDHYGADPDELAGVE
jgi:hypothetical protein